MVQGFTNRIVTLRQEMIKPVAAIGSVSTTVVSPVWLEPTPHVPLAPNHGAGFTIVDSSLTNTTEAHNPAHNPLSILSRLTHLLKNSLSSLT
jgi:hypothetical protein